MIERIVYIPSKLLYVTGQSEEDILRKTWEKLKEVYSGKELSVLATKIMITDGDKWGMLHDLLNPTPTPEGEKS